MVAITEACRRFAMDDWWREVEPQSLDAPGRRTSPPPSPLQRQIATETLRPSNPWGLGSRAFRCPQKGSPRYWYSLEYLDSSSSIICRRR
jgi:hypothetical protein